MRNIYMRYFIFSKQNLNQRKTVNSKTGREYTPGMVVVNGVPKVYTDIILDMSKAPADAILLTSGDIRKISYTKESTRKL